MPVQKTITASFTGGEFSPRMLARVDIAAYERSLKTLTNGFPLTHGGVQRRLGTKYLGEVRDSARPVRLIPYTNSKTQSFVLVINGGKMEFIKNGAYVLSGSPATPYSISVPWDDDELDEVTYAQAGNIMFFAHPNHHPAQLGRSTDTSWALTNVDFTTNAISGHRFENNFIAFTIVQAGDGHDVGDYYRITVTGGGGASVTGPFNASGGEAPVGAMAAVAVNSDNIVAQIWTIECTVKSETREEWDVLGSVSGRPSVQWSSNDYPKAVAFHAQRLWYAGSNTRRQTMWGSSAGDYTVFTAGPLPNDGLNFTIASNKFDQILHLESARQLLIFTYGAEFTLSGAVGGVSPAGVEVRRHTMHGTAEVKPIRIGQEMIFVQRDGKKVRAVSFDVTLDANVAPDITILAEHITREGAADGITDMTFQQDPEYVAWAIRDDGVLLSLTHLREQEVTAWATHTTQNGLFENVTSIPEGNSDTVYTIVNRTIGSPAQTVRYVEYFCTTGECYTDSHLSGTAGTPTTTWTGLDHLQGETVATVGDGRAYPEQAVTEITPSNWGVVLSDAVSSVTIGTPYTTTVEMQHPNVPLGDGTSHGRQLTIKKAIIRQLESIGLYVNNQDIANLTFPITLDGGPNEFTGDRTITVAGWTPPNNLLIEQRLPLKWTLLGVILHTQTNE